MIYLIIVTIALLLSPLGIWPRVKTTDRAWNTPFSIEMPPITNIHYFSQQSYRGVYAQEVIESYLSWLIALLVSLPVAYFNQFAGLGVFYILVLLSRKFFFNEIEYIGHTVEIILAERQGWDSATYIDMEARSCIDAGDLYKSAFKNKSVTQVKSIFNNRRPIAKMLLALFSFRLRNIK